MIRISDERAQAAFDVLESNQHAVARAAYEYAEKNLKVVLAKAEQRANCKTVGERQASALASEEYADALTDFQLIARAYYEARDKRDAASATIDAYRTQQSDLRAMGRIG